MALNRTTTMGEPAPEIIMDAVGNYWRRYPTHLSMVPTSDHNREVPEPYTVYLPAEFGTVYWRTLALRLHDELAALGEQANKEEKT